MFEIHYFGQYNGYVFLIKKNIVVALCHTLLRINTTVKKFDERHIYKNFQLTLCKKLRGLLVSSYTSLQRHIALSADSLAVILQSAFLHFD